MRDEDLDWEIYRALVDRRVRTAADLTAAGYDPSLVEASLGRLERSHLVERQAEGVRVLSLQEAILLCHLTKDRESPFILENGVLRARPEEERKQ